MFFSADRDGIAFDNLTSPTAAQTAATGNSRTPNQFPHLTNEELDKLLHLDGGSLDLEMPLPDIFSAGDGNELLGFDFPGIHLVNGITHHGNILPNLNTSVLPPAYVGQTAAAAAAAAAAYGANPSRDPQAASSTSTPAGGYFPMPMFSQLPFAAQAFMPPPVGSAPGSSLPMHLQHPSFPFFVDPRTGQIVPLLQPPNLQWTANNAASQRGGEFPTGFGTHTNTNNLAFMGSMPASNSPSLVSGKVQAPPRKVPTKRKRPVVPNGETMSQRNAKVTQGYTTE